MSECYKGKEPFPDICCCDCVFHKELVSHVWYPLNGKEYEHSGELIGYVCTYFEEDGKMYYHGTKKHGPGCESYWSEEDQRKYIRDKFEEDVYAFKILSALSDDVLINNKDVCNSCGKPCKAGKYLCTVGDFRYRILSEKDKNKCNFYMEHVISQIDFHKNIKPEIIDRIKNEISDAIMMKENELKFLKDLM